MGRSNLNNTVKNEYGIDIDVGNLLATPREIMRMMRIYDKHIDITNATLITKMEDSFLNQPTTEYNWRQGLPSGFSGEVKVYNKVGWNWDEDTKRWTIYNDAAIVDFTKDDRHFIVVVMTSGLASAQALRKLGSMIEAGV